MENPTPFAESNALLAMLAALEDDVTYYSEVDAVLSTMLPGERDRLARACRELGWYASDFTQAQARAAANADG